MMLPRFTSVALVLPALWATLATADKYPMGTGLSCSFLPKDCVPDPEYSKFCMSKDMECRAFRWSQSNPRESMIPLFEYSDDWTHADATKLVEDSYNHYHETGEFPVIDGPDFPLLPVCYDPVGHIGEMRLAINHNQLADNVLTFPCWCGQDGQEFAKFANAGGFMTSKMKPAILDRCHKLAMNDAMDGYMSPFEYFVQRCGQWDDERPKPAECAQIATEYTDLLAQKLSIPEATCRMLTAPIWKRVTDEYWGNIWKDRFSYRVDLIDVLQWSEEFPHRYHCFDASYDWDHYEWGTPLWCADRASESCGCQNRGGDPAVFGSHGGDVNLDPAWDGHRPLSWWVQTDMFNDLFEHYADHQYRNGEQIMCSGQYCLTITCMGPLNHTQPVTGAQIIELMTRKAAECPNSACATMQLEKASSYTSKESGYTPTGLLELEKVNLVQCTGLCGANEPARPVLTKGDSESGRPCIGDLVECPNGLPE